MQDDGRSGEVESQQGEEDEEDAEFVVVGLMVDELAVPLRLVPLYRLQPKHIAIDASLTDHGGDGLLTFHESFAELDVDHLEQTHHFLLLALTPPDEEMEGQGEDQQDDQIEAVVGVDEGDE